MTNAVTRPIQDPTERRDHDRRVVDSDSTLRDHVGHPHSVLVRDLSTHGFAAECEWELAIGATITLGLPGFGSAQAIVRRRDAQSGYGCQFIAPLPQVAFIKAFGEPNVVVAPFRTTLAEQEEFVEPAATTWSSAARLRLILGGSSILWVIVLKLL